jgi:hypothetical protein
MVCNLLRKILSMIYASVSDYGLVHSPLTDRNESICRGKQASSALFHRGFPYVNKGILNIINILFKRNLLSFLRVNSIYFVSKHVVQSLAEELSGETSCPSKIIFAYGSSTYVISQLLDIIFNINTFSIMLPLSIMYN